MKGRRQNCPRRVFEDKRLRKVSLLEWIYYVRPENSPAGYIPLAGSVDTPFGKAMSR